MIFKRDFQYNDLIYAFCGVARWKVLKIAFFWGPSKGCLQHKCHRGQTNNRMLGGVGDGGLGFRFCVTECFL